MTEIKICGINSEAAFDTCIEVNVNFIGFVFFQGSPRFVTPRQAASLSARTPNGPERVGLFVEPAYDLIKTILDALPLHRLQIYASESNCRDIRAKFNIKVSRAIGINSAADLPTQLPGIDSLIIESKAAPTATRPGGNATAFNWAITQNWQAPVPWLLAGGLTPNNVATALSQSNAPGVDVSSGVESLPGVKSPALIRRFVTNARSANSTPQTSRHRN